MKYFHSSLLLAAALFGAGGCSIFPTPANTETRYYDLDIPPRSDTNIQIEVSTFSTSAAERYRMSVRENGNLISGRDFHKWAQTPGPLVTKYLRLAFRCKPDETPAADKQISREENICRLSGSILLFEEDHKTAKLALHYRLSAGDAAEKVMISHTILVEQEMESSTPEAFAKAMSQAAAKAAKRILADAEAMMKSRQQKSSRK